MAGSWSFVGSTNAVGVGTMYGSEEERIAAGMT
jgi:hypothetical protein